MDVDDRTRVDGDVAGESPTDERRGLTRRDALKNTAKAGIAVTAAAGLLGQSGIVSALAASHDTTGKGKFGAWAGLSQGEVNVLRMVVQDPNFRASFMKNPKTAIKTSGEKLTPAQVTNLSRATNAQINNLVSGVALATADVAAGTKSTHTLIYAIVFAVAFALLLAVEGQEGSPTGGGAVPVA
jgi:hypothetical protein